MSDIVWDDEAPASNNSGGIVWDDEPTAEAAPVKEPPIVKALKQAETAPEVPMAGMGGIADFGPVEGVAKETAEHVVGAGKKIQSSYDRLTEQSGSRVLGALGTVGEAAIGTVFGALEGAVYGLDLGLKGVEALGQAAGSLSPLGSPTESGETFLKKKYFMNKGPDQAREFLEKNMPAAAGTADLFATPFVGPVGEIGERGGPWAQMAAEMGMMAGGVGMAARGRGKAPTGPDKAPSGDPKKSGGTAAEFGKGKEPTETSGTQAGQLELFEGTEIAPEFSGGSIGGIQRGRQLTVDENGMPIDLERSLDVANEASGRAKAARRELWDDLALDAKEQVAAANKAKEDAANMGPDVDAEMVRREKEAAWEDLNAADAAWKKMTEDEAWKERDANADPVFDPQQAIDFGFEERRDTALGAAMKEAGVVAMDGARRLEDTQMDPLPAKIDTQGMPASTLKNMLERTAGNWAAVWKNVSSDLRKWADENLGALVSEDSYRGAAARWKLLHDAATNEMYMLKMEMGQRMNMPLVSRLNSKLEVVKGNQHPNLFEQGKRGPRGEKPETGAQVARRIGEDAIRVAKETTAGDTAVFETFQRAVAWVSHVLPHLTRSASDIAVVDFHRFKEASDYYGVLVSKLDMKRARELTLQKYPEFKALVEKHPDKNLFHNGSQIKADKERGYYDPYDLSVGGKDIHRAIGIVFLNSKFVKQSGLINTVGTLVHELAHARHFRRVESRKQIGRDFDNNVAYLDRWTERNARQAQETARIKFSEMYAAELAEKGIGIPGAYYPKGPARVAASARADIPHLRSAGAVGAKRTPTGETAPRNVGMERAASTRAAMEEMGLVPAKRTMDAGEDIVAAGMREFGQEKFSSILATMPNVDTKTFLSVLGEVKNDINPQFGFRTGSYKGDNPIIGKKNSAADLVYAHVVKRFASHAANEHARNAQAMPQIDAFEHFYAADTLKMGKMDFGIQRRKDVRESGAREFAQDVKVASWFEKNPDKWFNGKDWYPTADKLVEKGMSPESAKVWRGVFNDLEKLWDTLDGTIKQAGGKGVPRVPGYLPHITAGPYRAIAFIPDETGAPKKYLAEVGGMSRKEAQANMELLKKYVQDEGAVFQVEEPKPGKHDIGAMLEGLRKARDIADNIKGLAVLNRIIEENAAKSIITHALKRSDPTKFGHELQRAGLYGEDFGLTLRQQMEAVRGMREYVKAVNGYAERIAFVKDTLAPLDMSGALEQSNLSNAVLSAFKDYVGISNINKIDTSIKHGLVKLGLDPQVANIFARNMQSGMAAFYLMGNIPFYAVNATQMLASFPVMMAKQSSLRNMGETKTPNVMQAMAEGSARAAKVILSEEMMLRDPVMKWGHEHGFLDPQAHEAIQPGRTFVPKDPITAGIDRRTRRIAFAYGYDFWKQVRSHEDALRLAGEFANEVSVPYNAQTGRPPIVGQLPVLGQAAALFSTYPIHVMSMLEQHVKLAHQGVKNKDPVATAQATGALLSYTGLQLALFGTMAVPFASAINLAIEQLNKLFGAPVIPSLERVGRMLDKAAGTNSLFQFGGMSTMMGYDVSSSAQGVTLQIPEAATRAVVTLGEAAILSGKAFMGSATKQDAWEFAGKLPGHYRGLADQLLRDYPNTTAQRHFADKGSPRSELDQMVMLGGGMRSIQEKAEMTTERLLKSDNELMSARFSRIEEKIKARGMTPELVKELNEVAAQFKQDPRSVIRAYQTWQRSKDMSPEMRKAMRGRTLRGAEQFQRYQQESGMEPMR